MEGISNDLASRAMASEMVKLLGDELKRVRHEIHQLQHAAKSERRSPSVFSSAADAYALQEENALLRQEIDDARRRIMELSSARSRTSKSESHGKASLKTEFHEEEERMIEYTAARDHLTAQVTKNQERYKEAKSVNAALQESITETQQMLKSVKEEKSMASARLAAAQLQRDSVKQFVPADFIGEHSNNLVPAPAVSDIPFLSQRVLDLPQAAKDLCVPGGFMSKISDEVVWRDEKKARFLAISSTHRYNPKLKFHDRIGGWEITNDMERHVGEQRDLFYMQGHRWHYIGTFRCMGRAVCPMEEIRRFVPQSVLDHASNKTILFRDMVPVVTIAMLQGMYKTAVLKVACTGWELVGFNTKLAEVLQATANSRPGIALGAPAVAGQEADKQGMLPVKRRGKAVETESKHRKKHRSK